MSEQGLLLTSIDELRKLCVELDPIVIESQTSEYISQSKL